MAGSVSTTEVWLMSCVVSSLYAYLERFFFHFFSCSCNSESVEDGILGGGHEIIIQAGMDGGRACGLIWEYECRMQYLAALISARI